MENKAVQNMPVERPVLRAQVRVPGDEGLIGLAQTIKETGVLQPLLLRRDGSEFVVVDGERRLKAARMAGLSHVPVIIDDRELSEAEVIHRQLVANCSREDLQPLEKAKAIQRLIAMTKGPAAQVAVKLGMSPGMVTKLLTLLKLPQSVQEQVASGNLAMTTAYALSQTPDADAQRELAVEAVRGGLSRETVVSRARGRKAKGSVKRHARKDRNRHVVLAIGEGCQVKAPAAATIQALAAFLSAFLERIAALNRMDMQLAEAVEALASEPAS